LFKLTPKKRGVKFGRKPKVTVDCLNHARKLIRDGKTPTQAAKLLRIGRATLYRALQQKAA
jgi:DNA invertase Pin-like site-specific DNA recombinase